MRIQRCCRRKTTISLKIIKDNDILYLKELDTTFDHNPDMLYIIFSNIEQTNVSVDYGLNYPTLKNYDNLLYTEISCNVIDGDSTENYLNMLGLRLPTVSELESFTTNNLNYFNNNKYFYTISNEIIIPYKVGVSVESRTSTESNIGSQLPGLNDDTNDESEPIVVTRIYGVKNGSELFIPEKNIKDIHMDISSNNIHVITDKNVYLYDISGGVLNHGDSFDTGFTTFINKDSTIEYPVDLKLSDHTGLLKTNLNNIYYWGTYNNSIQAYIKDIRYFRS